MTTPSPEESTAAPAACPAAFAMELVAHKWTIHVLFALHHAGPPVRFRRLQRETPPITQKELTKRLRELERSGLVSRRAFAEVPARRVSPDRPRPHPHAGPRSPPRLGEAPRRRGRRPLATGRRDSFEILKSPPAARGSCLREAFFDNSRDRPATQHHLAPTRAAKPRATSPLPPGEGTTPPEAIAVFPHRLRRSNPTENHRKPPTQKGLTTT